MTQPSAKNVSRRAGSRRRGNAGILFVIDADAPFGLQEQVRQKLIAAVVAGVFPLERKLPSSRTLAKQLGISRNTVVLAYNQLVAEGILRSRERSGIFVNEEVLRGRVQTTRAEPRSSSSIAFEPRMRADMSANRMLRPIPDWQRFPFPFVDGWLDHDLFPVAEWREASRLALGVREIQAWSTWAGDADDPALIEEIRTKILPRRGITVAPDEILVTLSARQAMHLVSLIFVDRKVSVAVEEPGCPDTRAILEQQGARLVPQAADGDGMIVGAALDGCDLAVVTPSQQRPTGATLSQARRKALLVKARRNDLLIVEDDVDCETNYQDRSFPALRGLSGGERVIYVATLSKVLTPGLGIGFLVAAPEVIARARRLRALIAGRPPLNNQRAAAFFLSLGHYDATMLRLGRIFRDRLIALRDALNHHLPGRVVIPPVRGGTTCWVRGPGNLDVSELIRVAETHGVIIEPIAPYYAANAPPNVFRLGITGVPQSRIRAGVALLAQVIKDISEGEMPARSARRGGFLTGTRLSNAMKGLTFFCRTVYGEPCTIALHPDGAMTGRAGYDNEDRDTGRWWIEDGQWCRQWNNWAYGEISRFLTRIDGDRIEWYRGGRLIDAATIVRES